MTLNLVANRFGPLVAALWIIETERSLGMNSRSYARRQELLMYMG